MPVSYPRPKDDCDALIVLFDQCFTVSANTRLLRGQGEPVYCPASSRCGFHQVIFAHGFLSSALHEVAHWCVAGAARRQQQDYGYWYAPDGRTQAQQKQFESVEVIPQAIEWMLSKACGHRFRISVDNLSGEPGDALPFTAAVLSQVAQYCRQGLPERAEQFRRALEDYFVVDTGRLFSDYSVDEL